MMERQTRLSPGDMPADGRLSGIAPGLIDQERRTRPGLLAWWYRITAPPEPPASASFKRRDLYRRGVLASTLMFVLECILIIVAPIGIIGPNHQILIVAVTLTIVIAITAWLNHRGNVNTAGLILCVFLNLGICSSILRSPGGIAPDTIAIFDLLVFSEVFFVSLLPINWVIFDALFNIAFSILVLTFWPRTPLFAEIMRTNFYTIVSRPVQLHIIVTAVLYLWVRSATQAIKRADRAEVVANLEHQIAEQGQQIAEEKRLLDVSIKEIIDTHMRVANGDYNARVPLQRGMPLWQVAGSLNNLLARIQRLQQDSLSLQRLLPQLQRARMMEHERQQIYSARERIMQEIESAAREGRPFHLSLVGTPLDGLAKELDGMRLQVPSRFSEEDY
jgi:hypothetical protein